MKIKFLGTCACDFTERLETEYRDKFDFNERRASAILINDRYLIDCGIHILDSFRISGCDISKVTDIFVTHMHSDHFDISNVEKMARGRKTPIRIWVREDASLPEIPNTELIKMTPYQKHGVDGDVTVTGVIANHDEDAWPQHLIMEAEGKRLFYGCDGAWLLTRTFNFIKGSDLDIMVLDATVGDYLGDYRIGEHNSVPMLRVMLPSFRSEGIITDKTKVIFSHIAPSLHKPHSEIERTAAEMGAVAAYDGMEMII